MSRDLPIALLYDDETQLTRPMPERALRDGRLTGARIGLAFKVPPSSEVCARFELRPVLLGVIFPASGTPIAGCEGR